MQHPPHIENTDRKKRQDTTQQCMKVSVTAHMHKLPGQGVIARVHTVKEQRSSGRAAMIYTHEEHKSSKVLGDEYDDDGGFWMVVARVRRVVTTGINTSGQQRDKCNGKMRMRR